MAIPVRLTVGNTANHRAINLEATGFNLAIERNISAFAMPFNNAFKAGIDPNMALTSVNIQGVLTDDHSAPMTASSSSMTIDFSSFYPQMSPSYWATAMFGIMANVKQLHAEVTTTSAVSAGTTSSWSVNSSGIGAWFVHTAGQQQTFANGNKIYADNGKEIGTITAAGSGAITIGGGGGTAIDLKKNQRILLHNPDTFLHGKGFVLMPQYWTVSGNEPDPSRPNTPIAYRFDGNSSPSVGGGSANPTFVAGSYPETGGIPTITIPIKGVYATPTTNPARALAAIVKAAIENTTPLTTKKTTAAGGRSSNDAFGVHYGDTDETVLIITQRNAGAQKYDVTPLPVDGYTNATSGQGILEWEYQRYVTGGGFTSSSVYQTVTDPFRPLHTLFSGGIDTQLPKRAGDKAQDLIGIFANSPVGDVDDIVGIQIPYNTLVTSESVSTEVRNFFLTFGKTITKDMKSSDGNTRPASQPIDLIGRSSDSPPNVTGQSTSGLVNAVETIWEGVTNVIESIWITYDTKTSGNRGGMLIIPAKLAIHQEAGQPYYTFDMRLHAAQHKIAP